MYIYIYSLKSYNEALKWRHNAMACPLFAQPFAQGHIKENITAPRHWPLRGVSTGDSLTKGH